MSETRSEAAVRADGGTGSVTGPPADEVGRDGNRRALGSRCCAPELTIELRQPQAEEQAVTHQLLGHPIRLQILDILTRNPGKICVCDLAEALPVKQPTVSHHLRILRESGLVRSVTRGLWAFYYVDRYRIARLATELRGFLETIEENVVNPTGAVQR